MEENPDFEEARHLELKLKNELKEKRLTLKANLAKTNTSEQVAVYNYQIKGEPIKMQVERTVKVYINGKEER
jgi:hypothetical protein